MYGPLRFTRTDLVAVTVQRGRDFGLRSYTDIRDALDLPPVETFEDLNPELSSSNPKVKPPEGILGQTPRQSVTLCRPGPVSCYAMLQTFIAETSQNWSSSPADFWSLSAARVRSFQPSSWTSLSGSGTGTVFGSRTGRTGTLPFNRQTTNCCVITVGRSCSAGCSRRRRFRRSAGRPSIASLSRSQVQKLHICRRMCFSGRMVHKHSCIHNLNMLKVKY